MNTKPWARILLATAFLGVAACGGGGDEAADPPAESPPPPPQPPAGALVGAAGGTVTGPNGAKVVIPAGALTTDTRILIELATSGTPSLPAGFTSKGQAYVLTPHGTTFAQPVTVTLPIDPVQVKGARTPGVYKTDAQNQWAKVTGATFGEDTVTAQVTSFSFFNVLDPPLVLGKPVYQYRFIELKGDALKPEEALRAISIQKGVEDHMDFRFAHRDAEVFSFDGTLIAAPDNKATAQIAATPDGGDWWVGVDAPIGFSGSPINTIGLEAVFKQTQSFIKRTPDAHLSFFITSAFLQTSDANGVLDRGCPRAHEVGVLCDMIGASVFLDVTGFTVPAPPFDHFDTFYKLGGTAALTGIAGAWHSEASTAAFSMHPLWNIEQFEFTMDPIDGAEEALITMDLAHPIFHEYDIDLSTVAVGQAFTIQFAALAKAYNRAASSVNNRGPEFETSARAYLRDPREPRGMTFTSEGLDVIESPEDVEPPPAAPVVPKACTPGPGPDPAAGTLQFGAASYRQSESNVAPAVTVTRTGGSRGAVTATIRTSDGSAVAGTDYDALAASVFFADGDSEPRVVTVQAIQDEAFSEPDETVNLTLSQPGGCAALGGQTTAVLTIQDDDEPPPPPSFNVGGTVSGLEGTGLTLRDQQFLTLTPGNGPFTLSLPVQSGSAYEVTIVAQPTNPVQVCSIANGSGVVGDADVTNIRVTCVTPSQPAGLDPGFGSGGIVSSAFGGDETDMLLQPDGKVIMVGGSASDFMLARYNADGSIDQGFGGGDGLVTTDIAGGADAAFGAALLADGRIIVVGSSRVGNNDNFAVVRYDANGDVDTTFGTQGKTTTDFFGQRDRAFAVAVQSDGKLVVVGDAIVSAGNTDFAVARYTAGGVLDATFGGAGAGKVNTDIADHADIAKNVVIGTGGSILVTGTITIGTSPALEHTGLARYTSAGLPDTSFGTDGTRSIPDLSLGEGLALQADGRIIVAGHSVVSGDRRFSVMRLTTGGAPDSGFGSAGLATVAFSTEDDFGRDVVFDAQGRILVSGQSSNRVNAAADFAVARFTTAGVLDTSFDGDGKFTVDFFDSGDSAENVLVQPDGRVLLGGFASNGNAVRYGVARFVP